MHAGTCFHSHNHNYYAVNYGRVSSTISKRDVQLSIAKKIN